MHIGNVMISVFLATLLGLVSPVAARTAMADRAAHVPGAVLPVGDDLEGAELLDAQGEAWRDTAWAQVRSQPRVSGNAFSNGHVGGGQGGGEGGCAR